MAANPLLLESLAFYGAAALGLGILALAGLALWQSVSEERPLLLADLLRYEGIDLVESVRGAGARPFALAARKCMACQARGQCEAWLGGREPGGYEAFCPNAGYVARLKG